ncbi:hypothetical protein SDRG_16288 [Saprolegnia diclina VS20]|uniref:Nucleoporin NDC1 n=1 Tax=Saprolegnia diclina (strain VS20) TaxID=1156394 RepID=T0PKD1_SAPDV|nr:hypothetical protein SDRG_16288 [Saprolegnia diclina VS20]EQC25839.1 hypothetical protein SDRG_16288 [Saprolegnia diclina VS20]|eukprot:XP_008620714.1 hypothetical protein SDRG_16288 [Saprolegnia diclina VS20]
MDRVRSRIAGALPGVVVSAVAATALLSLGGNAFLTLLATLRLTNVQAYALDVAQVVEWIAVSIGLVLLVLGSWAISIVLLFSLPQRLPSSSPAYWTAAAARALRMETVLLVLVLAVTSYLWHLIFVCYVSPSHIEHLGALSLVQGFGLSYVLAFSSVHPLAFRAMTDPIGALEASYGATLSVGLQYAFGATLVAGLMSWSLSWHALVSSSVLFAVLLLVHWTFAHLFARPGAASPPTPLTHAWLSAYPLPASPLADSKEPYRIALQKVQLDFLSARATAMKSKAMAPSYRALAIWEASFAAGDLVAAATKAPATLFASEATWSRTFQFATATLDLLTQQLQAVATWKSMLPAALGSVPMQATSWASLLRTLVSGEVTPLSLLSSAPSASAAWQRLATDMVLSLVFLSVTEVLHVVEAMGLVVAASYAKDKQGYVQLSVPAMLSSLLALRMALDAHTRAKQPAVDQLTLALDATLQRIATTYAKQQADILQFLPAATVQELAKRGLLTA